MARVRRQQTATESWLEHSLRPRLAKADGIEIDSVDLAAGGGAVTFDGWVLAEGVIWRVDGRLVVREADGVLVLSGLSLTAAKPPDAAVTSRVLNALPHHLLAGRVLDKLADDRRLDAAGLALRVPGVSPPPKRASQREAAKVAAAAKAPPRGRHGTPLEFYERLAVEAVQIASTGKGVVAELARRYERPEATVKTWLRKARTRGALDRRHRVWKLGPEHPAGREHR